MEEFRMRRELQQEQTEQRMLVERVVAVRTCPPSQRQAAGAEGGGDGGGIASRVGE